MEVAELSRQFHQMIGWRERKPGKNAWRSRRLRMTKEAYSISSLQPIFNSLHDKVWLIF